LAQVRHLSFSADGKRIVSSLVKQTGNLWSVPVAKASGERTSGATPFVEDTSHRKTTPMFSIDGSRVAYSVFIVGAVGSVWTVKANGQDRRQLTTDQSTMVGWMPDGNQLVSISYMDDGQFLTTTAADTGMKRTISKLSLQYPFCRLSPDGKTIAFNAYVGNSVNLWLYSIENGTTKQLTFDKELLGFPAWSPDGKWIAAELKRNDDTYVALVPVDGGTVVQLNSDQGQSWTGSWSPDGDKIAYAGSRNGVWNIWWISRSTRKQEQLTTYTKPNSFVRYPTWSPRGDQIVYEYSELTGNIWMADLK
jgi:Tol biopolymer transport system component